MPWLEQTRVKARQELAVLTHVEGANLSRLARRFGVSRKTAYKWKARYSPEDAHWAQDRCRRPARSPLRVDETLEALVASVRLEHPSWGARKILWRLHEDGFSHLPAASTVCAILRRLGLLGPRQGLSQAAPTRFEHAAPNDLWQMDFKGPIAMSQGRCHPLTVVDDHSRYALAVRALGDERASTTKPALIEVFRLYGLPVRMFVDNGSCWGRALGVYTAFTAWLLRLGIRVSYSRPFHPQSRGKNERFHRTLNVEALQGRTFTNLGECQRAFDQFREMYNTDRPHEGIAMQVPASRYTLSPRPYPESLPGFEYFEDDIVRQVGRSGFISLGKDRYHVGRAFSGCPVALRATARDGVYDVYFSHQRVARIDRRDRTCEQM